MVSKFPKTSLIFNVTTIGLHYGLQPLHGIKATGMYGFLTDLSPFLLEAALEAVKVIVPN